MREAPFFNCVGCKVMFLDPIAFTAFDPNGVGEGRGEPGKSRRPGS